MRWTPGDRSNIEDRRGMSGVGVGGLGHRWACSSLLLLSWFTGVDFLSLLGGSGGPATETTGTSGSVTATPEEEKLVDMADSVMADAQQTWEELLGSRYQRTTLVLFRDATQSTCGFAQSATGPFYCPADRKVYLDLGFFSDLHRQLGAPGHFAQAYVIAHELGHHVQTLTGIESQVRRRQSADPSSANALSVRMELQADCLAGVWGHHANRDAGPRADRSRRLRAGHERGGRDRRRSLAADAGRPRRPRAFHPRHVAQRSEWLRRGYRTVGIRTPAIRFSSR